jgi:hypothetical protein
MVRQFFSNSDRQPGEPTPDFFLKNYPTIAWDLTAAHIRSGRVHPSCPLLLDEPQIYFGAVALGGAVPKVKRKRKETR